MTYDEFHDLALGLPEVEDGMSYGSLCVKRKGRMMFAPKDEGDIVAIKLDWNTHNRILEENPDTFYKTAHYEGWPWLLVRLSLLSSDQARELVECSWSDAPKPAKIRKRPPG